MIFLYWTIVGIAIGIGLMLAPFVFQLGVIIFQLAIVLGVIIGMRGVIICLFFAALFGLVYVIHVPWQALTMTGGLLFAVIAIFALHEVFWYWHPIHPIAAKISYGYLGLVFAWIATVQLDTLLDISMPPGPEPNPYALAAVLFCVGSIAAAGHFILEAPREWLAAFSLTAESARVNNEKTSEKSHCNAGDRRPGGKTVACDRRRKARRRRDEQPV